MLNDEIAQTLLGINVRLLTLKRAAKGSPETLAQEIARTERLVEESMQSIDRFAQGLEKDQEQEWRLQITESE